MFASFYLALLFYIPGFSSFFDFLAFKALLVLACDYKHTVGCFTSLVFLKLDNNYECLRVVNFHCKTVFYSFKSIF